MKLSLNQKGDTLVEVLMASVVMSIVLAGAYTITNRASRVNQSAIERTEIANQMTEQLEFIRGARNDLSTAWDDITANYVNSSAGSPSYDACEPSPAAGKLFYMDNSGNPQNYSFNATGGGDAYPDDIFATWVEAYNAASNDYIEFHVRGCWEGIGSEGDQSVDLGQRSVLVLRIRK